MHEKFFALLLHTMLRPRQNPPSLLAASSEWYLGPMLSNLKKPFSVESNRVDPELCQLQGPKPRAHTASAAGSPPPPCAGQSQPPTPRSAQGFWGYPIPPSNLPYPTLCFGQVPRPAKLPTPQPASASSVILGLASSRVSVRTVFE